MTKRWPIDPSTPVTSGFGYRPGFDVSGAPSWQSGLHDGTDYAADYGTPVYAAHAGTLRNLLDPGGYGKYVQIDGDGVMTQYGHVRDMWIVPDGTRVEGGEHIGGVGSEGMSTGPHLHFRVHVDGVPTDPMVWLEDAVWGEAAAPTDNEALCARFFKSEGFSDAGIAGALANFHAESKFDPAVVEGGGYDLSVIDDWKKSGVGLAQWSFSRRVGLFAFADGLGEDWRDIDVQFAWIRHEVAGNSDYRALWDRLSRETDPVQASYDFDSVYEGSGYKGTRFDTARGFYDKVVAGVYWSAGAAPAPKAGTTVIGTIASL